MTRIGICKGCLAAQRGVRSRIAIPHTCTQSKETEMGVTKFTPKLFQKRCGFKSNKSPEPISYSLCDTHEIVARLRNFDGFGRWIVLHLASVMGKDDGMFYWVPNEDDDCYLQNSFDSAQEAFESFKKFYP